MLRVLLLVSSLALSKGIAYAQTLEHDPAPCMDTETFPLIEARASSPDPGRLTVRFKADGEGDWYEVALQSTGGAFRTALPKPILDAVRVSYYISSSRESVRTPEYLVNVLMGGCPGARSAPPELTASIDVRRTSGGQPEIPIGFSPEGIRTGGMTARGTLGIVGGAAGGAAVAALALMGDETTTESPDPGSPEALRACFTPDPIPDVESGATLRFDASCTTPITVTTYQWNFGDGSTGEGTSVEHLFRPGGVYSVTLTVRDGSRSNSISRLVRVRATPSACFTTNPNPPRIFVNDSISFNAECSVGDRDGGTSRLALYEWQFGDGRPGAEGRFVSRQFTRPDVYGVTLTVTNDDGRQDQTTQFVVVERRVSGGRIELSFVSHLELPQGASAQVSVNDAETIASTAGSPQQYRAGAREGENLFDGRLLAPAKGPGRWHFDFTRTSGFVPGSIRVDSGDVLALETQGVVFRVDSDSTAPIRFRFRVEE